MSAVLKIETTGDRSRFIGGSDVAAIMGVSPWATPADVYYRKHGMFQKVTVDPMRERIYRRGKRLEPIVIEMLREELGLDVVKVSTDKAPNRYIDPEHAFLAAEIDFEWRVRKEDREYFPWANELPVGSIQNGEIKTVAPYPGLLKKWGEMDTDEVPIEYAFQSMHGLGVSGRQVCLYGVLFGSDNLVTYFVGRDEETIRGIRSRCVRFWHDHILAKVPPPPQTIEDLQRMYLKASLATQDADSTAAAQVLELHSVMDEVAALEARKEELAYQLMHAMGSAEALVDERGRTLVTWKNSTFSQLDERGLKAAHPDIFAAFYETRPTRRFNLTGRRNRK